MKTANKQSGRTLVEMTVVIAAIVLLGGFGLPAVRTFLDSFESGTGARPVISAALASARAIAAREQRYAGIRFQKVYNSNDILNPLGGVLEAAQYMVFIVQNPDMMAWGFQAVEGLKPMKLPDNLGVMDLTIVTNRNVSNPVNSQQARLDDPSFTPAQKDNWLSNISTLTDISTFSIIFSPSGKLVIHGIRIRNRDGEGDSVSFTDFSMDDIFNKKAKVEAGIGMFYQDDYFAAPLDLGLGPEPSRRSFIIYDRREFKRAYERSQAYSGYLVKLISDAIYINPYTGTMIEK